MSSQQLDIPVDIPANATAGNLRGHTPRDAFKLNLNVLIRAILVFGAFVCFWKGLIPFWAYFLVVLPAHPVAYLYLHDLCHGFRDSQIWFTSRHPAFADPFWGGMRTIKDTHIDHHKYLGTDRDPWLRLYDGSPWAGAFWNFFESELLAYKFVRKNGFEPIFVRGALFHAACMIINSVIFGPLYWLHVLVLRSLRATAIFFFNYYVHRSSFSKDAEYGVYEREKDLGPIMLPLFRLVFGKNATSGLVYHNRHHDLRHWNLQVKYYPEVGDTGNYSNFIKQWPISTIRSFEEVSAKGVAE